MPALYLRFVTLLCLVCVVLGGTEKCGVVFRDISGNVTIQCRISAQKINNLEVKRGLLDDEDVFATNRNPDECIISDNFTDRLKFDISDFPNVDIVLSRLTVEDTAVYRCQYGTAGSTFITENGNGSVLLVVKSEPVKEEQSCPTEAPSLLPRFLLGFSILVVIISGLSFIIWIIKTQRKKSRRTITNDVYEDMRGTLRH